MKASIERGHCNFVTESLCSPLCAEISKDEGPSLSAPSTRTYSGSEAAWPWKKDTRAPGTTVFVSYLLRAEGETPKDRQQRQRERERERETERERQRQRRERGRVCVCVTKREGQRNRERDRGHSSAERMGTEQLLLRLLDALRLWGSEASLAAFLHLSLFLASSSLSLSLSLKSSLSLSLSRLLLLSLPLSRSPPGPALYLSLSLSLSLSLASLTSVRLGSSCLWLCGASGM